MKTFLLYGLLLGSSALAATIPAGAPPALDARRPRPRPHRKLAFNRKILPGEINRYLHPEIRITQNSIDCAGTQPIVVDGKVHGCFFTNTEEEILDAVEALTIAKNLTDVAEDPDTTEDPIPEGPVSLSPRQLAEIRYKFKKTYCHSSGLFAPVSPDFSFTIPLACASMDTFAGKYVKSVSWVFASYGEADNPINMYAWASTTRIRHDYSFLSLKPNDDWVWSSFKGQCSYITTAIIYNLCLVRGVLVSRGGYIDAFDPIRAPSERAYRIGVDPNPLSGLG